MRKLLAWLALAFIAVAAAAYALLSTERGQDWALERLATAAMSSPDVVPFEGLRATMCGTASPLPAPNRAQACVAIEAGSALYVVDAGTGSANVANLAALPLNRLEALLLTHFHSDHIASVPDFNLNSWVAGRSKPLDVIGPDGVDAVVAGFNDTYAHDRSYRIAHHGEVLLPPALGELNAVTIRAGKILEHGGLVIRAFTMDHAPVVPAVGYRFDYGGRSIVVSGDGNVTRSLIEAARGADLVLQDALSLPIVAALERAARAAGRDRQAKILNDIQTYHAHADSLAELVRSGEAKMIGAYHLVPPPRNWLFEQIFRRELPDRAVLTHDGMVFELAAGRSDIVVR